MSAKIHFHPFPLLPSGFGSQKKSCQAHTKKEETFGKLYIVGVTINAIIIFSLPLEVQLED